MVNKIWPFLFLLVACANQATLTGGSKDVKYPKVISSKPKNYSVKTEPTVVELEFNELIKIGQTNKIIITPYLDPAPNIEANRKSVKITFQDTLDSNTTYAVRFNGSLMDVNEGNSNEDLVYVFSTGSILDTLNLSGNVQLRSSNGGKDKLDVLVGLYKEPGILKDSLLPIYYTKTEENGDYKFDYVKSGRYFVRTFEDLNRDFKFQSNEMIGLEKEAIDLDSSKDSIALILTTENNVPVTYTAERTKIDEAKVAFSHAVGFDYRFHNVDDVSWNFNRDTATLRFPKTDSPLVVTAGPKDELDSIKIDSFEYEKSLRFEIKTIKLRSDSVASFMLITNNPFKSVIDTSLKLLIDSTVLKPLKMNVLSPHEVKLNYGIYKFEKHQLKIDSAAFQLNDTLANRQTMLSVVFEDVFNRNKLSFTINKETISESTELWIELLDKEGKLQRRVKTRESEVVFNRLEEGSYSLRISVDLNGNGVIDRTDAQELLEAEPVINTPTYRIDQGFDLLKNDITI